MPQIIDLQTLKAIKNAHETLDQMKEEGGSFFLVAMLKEGTQSMYHGADVAQTLLLIGEIERVKIHILLALKDEDPQPTPRTDGHMSAGEKH